MKRNSQPELDANWWRKNQAAGLASANGLEKALDKYAQALQDLQKSRSEDDAAGCVKAIDAIEEAAKKVQAEAKSTLKNPPKGKFDEEDMRNTADTLARFERVLETARGEAKALVDEGDRIFDDHDRYRHYLKDGLVKLQTGPMMFALGAGARPEEHRLMLHRTDSGTSLMSKLHTRTGLKKITLGVATADVKRPTTLVLDLQGPPLTGIEKKFNALRKHFGPLAFDRVVLMVKGVEVPDEIDPEDPVDEAPAGAAPTRDPEALKAQLKALMPAITRSIAANPTLKARLLGLVEQCKAQIHASQLDAAAASLDAIETLVASSGPAPAGAASALINTKSGAPAPDATPYDKAREAWVQARSLVRAELVSLEQAIIEQSRAESDFDDIETGCEGLYDILDDLDDRLEQRLQAAAGATTEDARRAQHAQAVATVAEYRAFVDSDELLGAVDSNPFRPVKVSQTLRNVLGAIATTLA